MAPILRPPPASVAIRPPERRRVLDGPGGHGAASTGRAVDRQGGGGKGFPRDEGPDHRGSSRNRPPRGPGTGYRAAFCGDSNPQYTATIPPAAGGGQPTTPGSEAGQAGPRLLELWLGGPSLYRVPSRPEARVLFQLRGTGGDGADLPQVQHRLQGHPPVHRAPRTPGQEVAGAGWPASFFFFSFSSFIRFSSSIFFSLSLSKLPVRRKSVDETRLRRTNSIISPSCVPRYQKLYGI